MLSVRVLSGGILIGLAELYASDPPMGVASGRLRPTSEYDRIRPSVDALNRSGAPDWDSLRLEVVTEEGVVLEAAGGIMIEDSVEEGHDEPPEISVCGINCATGHVQRVVWNGPQLSKLLRIMNFSVERAAHAAPMTVTERGRAFEIEAESANVAEVILCDICRMVPLSHIPRYRPYRILEPQNHEWRSARRATEADAEVLSLLNADVQSLHAAAMPERFKPLGPDTFPTTAARALLAAPGNLIFIAEVESEPIGYAYAEVVHLTESAIRQAWDEIHLHHISVRPAYRRKGVASALLNSVRVAAGEIGINLVTLQVWTFNEDAQSFFRRQGFTPYMARLWSRLDG